MNDLATYLLPALLPLVKLIPPRWSLLLETAAAAARLHDVVRVAGVSEIMVGLNDLHRSFGLANHFEMLASEMMTTIGSVVRDAGIRFGFGGVGRPADRELPVPADLVIA